MNIKLDSQNSLNYFTNASLTYHKLCDIPHKIWNILVGILTHLIIPYLLLKITKDDASTKSI